MESWKRRTVTMSNFKCDKCGMVNIDCGSKGYKTPREIELENKLQVIREVLKEIEIDIRRATRNTWSNYTGAEVERAKELLKLIDKAKDGGQ